MELFENERINISGIRTVNLYESVGEAYDSCGRVSYGINLATYELIFFLSGRGITCFGEKTIEDMPNSIRFLPRGIGEGKYTVEKIEDGVCIDIYFDTEDEMPSFAVGLRNMNELRPLFVKICNIWQSKRAGYYTEAMSVMYEIVNKIKKHSENYGTSKQAEKIRAAEEYMSAHFADYKFNYGAMCAETGLSYDYFKELFIKVYKMSPVKYITAMKLEKAKEMLITGRYSVARVAAECGFENIYYFSTVFKKKFGVSPKNYFNQNRI